MSNNTTTTAAATAKKAKAANATAKKAAKAANATAKKATKAANAAAKKAAKAAAKRITVRKRSDANDRWATVIRLCRRANGATGPQLQEAIDSPKRPSHYSLSRCAKAYGFEFEQWKPEGDHMHYRFIAK